MKTYYIIAAIAALIALLVIRKATSCVIRIVVLGVFAAILGAIYWLYFK